MCGILALLGDVLDCDGSALTDAIAALRARGPEAHRTLYLDGVNGAFYFQRLAIQGTTGDEGMQPFSSSDLKWMCNGEIYNSHDLMTSLGKKPRIGESDCAVIGHTYKAFGIERCLQMIDGVFGMAICDTSDKSRKLVHIARDPFGVRPLYMLQGDGWHAVASDVKTLTPFAGGSTRIEAVPPGSYLTFRYVNGSWHTESPVRYFRLRYSPYVIDTSMLSLELIDEMTRKMIDSLVNAVFKRVTSTERPVACLLSGGLDSSLITALVARMHTGDLRTYCIGMRGSTDLDAADVVARHIANQRAAGIHHTQLTVPSSEFLAAIPDVIKAIESYDTTTVRASVGNYLVAKAIASKSDAKVVFNGDGSDEVTGGYIYTAGAGSDIEFDNECRRLVENISNFDVLRSDRSISSNGLEPRTPFLDRTFVDTYFAIPAMYRNHKSTSAVSNSYWDTVERELIKSGSLTAADCIRRRPEKLLLRYAIHKWLPGILPDEILWRSKEAFSDGVSNCDMSWHRLITEGLEEKELPHDIDCENNHLVPATKEQLYYRHIFNNLYPQAQLTIPYFWMPRWSDTSDPSARTLTNYGK